MSWSLFAGGPVPTLTALGGHARHLLREQRDHLRYAGCWLEPMTGMVGPRPVQGSFSSSPLDWESLLGSFAACPYVLGAGELVSLVQQTSLGPWALRRVKPLAPGEGFRLALDLMEEEGQVAFGGWTLEMERGGLRLLWRDEQVAAGSIEADRRLQDARRRVMTVFCVGDTLCLRWDPEWQIGMAVPCPEPVWSRGIAWAHGGGKLTVAGGGVAWIGYSTLAWEPSWRVELAEPVGLVQPTNTAPDVRWWGVTPAWHTVSIALVDEANMPWDPGGIPRSAFRWIAEVAGPSTDLPYWLGRVDVRIPATRGVAGPLREALPVTALNWTRTWGGATTVEAELGDCTGAGPAVGRQAGVRLDLERDGQMVFTGVSESPEVSLDAVGSARVRADALARLWQVGGFDSLDVSGLRLDDALAYAFEFCGIDPSALSIPALPYPIETEREPVAPVAGEPGGNFLSHLLETYAADHYLVGLPGFGYQVRPWWTGVDHGELPASGCVGVYRPLEGSWEEENFANVVLVVGRDDRGSPLTAMAWTPWTAGQPWTPRLKVLRDDSLQTRAAVQWVCRQAFAQWSRPRARWAWAGSEIPGAEPGDTVTLPGGPQVRLLRISFDIVGADEEWRYEAEAL